MSGSEQWILIKRILGQAYVVLEELAMPLHWNNADPRTQSNVQQAKDKIAKSIQDQADLEQAAEIIEYQSLLQKLEAMDTQIDQEVIDLAREL